jgi:predicted N-acetyltransferase YhbS
VSFGRLCNEITAQARYFLGDLGDLGGNHEADQPMSTEPLSDGLVMRTAVDGQDIARVAAFNGRVHGPGLAPATESLMAHYPGIALRDLVFVEDSTSGEVVSSILLIPWNLRYGKEEVSVGEMGLVGTTDAYRNRGLVRTQVAYFKQRLCERGCLLSLIAGIPFFYRQFGYEYAMPLEGGLVLGPDRLPSMPETTPRFRLATADDLTTLASLYDDATQALDIHAVRSTRHWRYLLSRNSDTELSAETWLIEDSVGQTGGYFRLPEHHFGRELTVSEVSNLSWNTALATLHHVGQLAQSRGKPGVRLNLPPSSTLMRVARSLDAHDLGTYAWQVHVPDLAALLRTLGPELESRLAVSPFADLSQDVQLCFYKESTTLRFEQGKLVEVLASGPAHGAINLPPLAFIPVLLGYRTVPTMKAVFPDISVAPEQRLLFETLFPPMDSFLYLTY